MTRACLLPICAFVLVAADAKYYFPPPGESLDNQNRCSAEQAGLDRAVLAELENVADRWALWRNGRLIHVKGDFNLSHDVASNRKTWHAMIVGAALQNGKIPSLQQKLSVWNKELKGKDAEATWWHVLTQSAGFDYPYGSYPDYDPGMMWTYSDLNLVNLCNAVARVHGKSDYKDNFDAIAKTAYFDAIGMRGWSTVIKKDTNFVGPDDGVRFVLDLEDMGRLGLLALNRGNWNGRQLIPASFIQQLETKQTRGMLVNYDGPNDGKIGRDPNIFPESPYGLLTWVNTDRDLFPGADSGWALASGKGGYRTMWNRKHGIVFAAVGMKNLPRERDVPQIIESHLRQASAQLTNRGATAR